MKKTVCCRYYLLVVVCSSRYYDCGGQVERQKKKSVFNLQIVVFVWKGVRGGDLELVSLHLFHIDGNLGGRESGGLH